MQTTALLQKDAAKASVSTTQGRTTTNPLQPVSTGQNPLQMKPTGQNLLRPLIAQATGNPLQSYAQGNPLQQSKKENRTGLPDNLKEGVENMSGYSMDDVKVHYNSDKPAQLQALAYAQGADIHAGPGQEQHLPHEAWHVVQQNQGRVQPIVQMKAGIKVNDDNNLEREADFTGGKALAPQSQKLGLSSPIITSKRVVQQKGRIDLTKIANEDKKGKIERRIEELKNEKRMGKNELVKGWVGEADGSKDEDFNDKMSKIRKNFEIQIKGLSLGLPKEAYVSGSNYYGDLVPGTDNVYKRPDNNKQYVKDMRDTFVRRHVRREINQNDIEPLKKGDNLAPTGLGTRPYKDLLPYPGSKIYKEKKQNKVHDLEGMTDDEKNENISWPHTEFMQQSRGGGGNQFAFSHTSTKRPILSNDHRSFGAFPNGAILTDLSKIKKDEIAAQWGIDPTWGHKVMLGEGKHKQLGSKIGFDNRDKTVRMSGYRNSEVVTPSIPNNAIVRKPDSTRPDHEWNGPDIEDKIVYNNHLEYDKLINPVNAGDKENAHSILSKMAYQDGVSFRGNLMKETSKDLEVG